MKKIFSLCAVLFGLFLLSPDTVRSDTDSTIKTLREFEYDKVTKLNSMEKYARDGANKFLNNEFKSKATQWVSEARDQWVKEKGEVFQTIGVGVSKMTIPWEKSPEYRNFLKSELNNRMKLEFPKQIDSFVRNDLLQGGGAGVEAQAKADMGRLVSKISGRVMGDVEGMVNQTIDQWGNSVNSRYGFGYFGGAALQPESPTGFLDSLSNQLGSKMGQSTKEGMKDFIDSKMFDQFGKNFATS